MNGDEGRYDFEQTLVSHVMQIKEVLRHDLFIDVWTLFRTRPVRKRLYGDATTKKSFGKKQERRRAYRRRWKKKEKHKETYVNMQ